MRFKKIYVEITNVCNLNCSFCNNNGREKKFMSVASFEHVIEEISKYTKYIYLHVKGEPLLHPDLDQILTICDLRKIEVNITTNGTLLSEKKDILSRHKCVRQVNVSLHSENKVENYFDKVFNTCVFLRDKTYINYRLWTLKNNRLDLFSTEIVKKIIAYYNLSGDIIDEVYNKKNIKIDINTYIDKADLFEWPNLNNKTITNGYCHGIMAHVGILVDGTVVPCCLDGEGVVNLGNIFSTSFGEILNSNRFVEMEKHFKNNLCSEELCKHCRFKDRFNNN